MCVCVCVCVCGEIHGASEKMYFILFSNNLINFLSNDHKL